MTKAFSPWWLGFLLVLVVFGWSLPASAQVGVMVHPRSINVKAKGKAKVSVVFLGSATFDPLTVDPATLRLGPAAAPTLGCELEEADEDEDEVEPGEIPVEAFPTLVCKFARAALGVTCADTSLTVTGALLDGTPLTATDAIRPVPCHK